MNHFLTILQCLQQACSRLLDSLDLSHPTYYRGAWSRLIDNRFARDVYFLSSIFNASLYERHQRARVFLGVAETIVVAKAPPIPLTLVVENFYSQMHSRNDMLTVLEFAYLFVPTIRESLKQLTLFILGGGAHCARADFNEL